MTVAGAHSRLFSRRMAIGGCLGLSGCMGSARGIPYDPAPPFIDIPSPFELIEARVGGRVGVAALNVDTGQAMTHRADERFAMCSSFKWLLAAAALARLPHRQTLPIVEADLIFHSPVTRARAGEGGMSVMELAQATVETSDNAAANILLRALGGPEGFTAYLRSQGDAVTRLDRYELELNENAPGDARDTTTPAQAVRSLRHFLVDGAYAPPLRVLLINWLQASATGRARLRAGLPAEWRAGDKTGTSDDAHNATIDVAIAFPPSRPPILIACFLSDSLVPLAERTAAHAEIGRIVAAAWS